MLLEEDSSEPTTEAYLRALGFGDRAIETLFRPLFGVILLDRDLGADPGYFRFLLADAGARARPCCRATAWG